MQNTQPTMLSRDRLCIHQITLMQCDFRESIACFARHGVRQTAVWHEKLQGIDLDEAARILKDHDVSAISVCVGGLLTSRNRADYEKSLAASRHLIDAAQAFGAQSVVVITGGLDEGDTDLSAARERFMTGLGELVPYARNAGVKLSLEPLHPMVCGFRSVISTLRDAMDLLDSLSIEDGDKEVLGLTVDTYALWWDLSLQRDIANAAGRIVNFHVSDWRPHTRDVRVDRAMIGDGQINNREIRGWVEAAGYEGSIEVEILSAEDWWKRDPDEVVGCVLDRIDGYL